MNDDHIRVQIGDGVAVEGPQSIVREALGAADTEDQDELYCSWADDIEELNTTAITSFYQHIQEQMRQDVTFAHVDSLVGLFEEPPVDTEAETKTEPFKTPVFDDPHGCPTEPDGPPGPVGPPVRFEPGARVWDVGTQIGPWVLIHRLCLEIPVELPPEPDTYRVQRGMYVDPTYDVSAYRPFLVPSWVVETEPWRFQIVPEACLTDEAPLDLTDEMVEELEAEAAQEAEDDVDELLSPSSMTEFVIKRMTAAALVVLGGLGLAWVVGLLVR